MPKEGDIAYLKNIGVDGIVHAFNKPFSDDDCGKYLIELGTILTLLPKPPAKLLDLGCGTGWTSCFFAKRGYEVIGQDISDDMINYSNKNKSREGVNNINFIASDFENMSFNEEFDCAVFFDSLHHAESEELALLSVYKALKPGGICVTSEPGIGHARKKLTIESVKKYNVTEKDMPPLRIIKAAKKAGFSKYRIYPRLIHINKVLIGEFNQTLIKHFLTFDFIRSLSVFAISSFLKQYHGIVVLRK